MAYLLDTNILIHLVRDDEMGKLAEKFIRDESEVLISVVTVGEIKAIALQRKWAKNRLQILEKLFQRFLIADIHTEEIVNCYAEIDAFSQGKHPTLPLQVSARNMGKNDIWIAATTSVYGLTLLSTDNDFAHLADDFVQLQLLKINNTF